MIKEEKLNEIDLTKVNVRAKARYWNAVLYPESMIPTWEDDVDDLLEYPYAYCVHDKDINKADMSHRKTHIHFIIAFPNTTTYNNVLTLFNRLGVCNYVEPVRNVRNSYNYLIHNTDKARKDGKHEYDVSERITGNSFDIGAYEQLSLAESEEILLEIKKIIREDKVNDFYELDEYIDTQIKDTAYSTVFRKNQSFLYNLMKSKYNHDRNKKKQRAKEKYLNEMKELEESFLDD